MTTTDLTPLPAVGDVVALATPVLGATHGTVTSVGTCGYPRCGAGDRCVTISITTARGGHTTINRTPADLEPAEWCDHGEHWVPAGDVAEVSTLHATGHACSACRDTIALGPDGE